jgi:hypothetical protein
MPLGVQNLISYVLELGGSISGALARTSDYGAAPRELFVNFRGHLHRRRIRGHQNLRRGACSLEDLLFG